MFHFVPNVHISARSGASAARRGARGGLLEIRLSFMMRGTILIGSTLSAAAVAVADAHKHAGVHADVRHCAPLESFMLTAVKQ